MIEITNLRFDYPKSDFQLKIDELIIESGQKVAVVGPSGSGKTTLLNLISGIAIPRDGQIVVSSETISTKSDSQRRDFRISKIGMVFQQFELIHYLPVLENILLPFYVNDSLKLTRDETRRAREAAGAMGLGDKLGRSARKLSQGEQQRVAICRALVNRPKLILADEPTGNLDPKNKNLILDLLFEYASNENATVVVVTHDVSILEGFDRVIDFENFRSEANAEAGPVEVSK